MYSFAHCIAIVPVAVLPPFIRMNFSSEGLSEDLSSSGQGNPSRPYKACPTVVIPAPSDATSSNVKPGGILAMWPSFTMLYPDRQPSSRFCWREWLVEEGGKRLLGYEGWMGKGKERRGMDLEMGRKRVGGIQDSHNA